MLSEIWNRFVRLEKVHPSDNKEMEFYIHGMETIIMSRCAVRMHPDIFINYQDYVAYKGKKEESKTFTCVVQDCDMPSVSINGISINLCQKHKGDLDEKILEDAGIAKIPIKRHKCFLCDGKGYFEFPSGKWYGIGGKHECWNCNGQGYYDEDVSKAIQKEISQHEEQAKLEILSQMEDIIRILRELCQQLPNQKDT